MAENEKSCNPSEVNSLIDRHDKDTELNAIFKLLSDGEPKTVIELAQLTGYSNAVICEHLRTILSWKVVEYIGTLDGAVCKSYQLRKDIQC